MTYPLCLNLGAGLYLNIDPNCYGQAGLWRVDITNHAAGLDEAQQQALPNNTLLLAYPTWRDFGHLSTAARGPLRDWALLVTEDGTDTFNSGSEDGSGNITPWHAYRQEIIAITVVTGEIRRLAHHRSRSIGSDYYSQPRLSVSWGGSVIGFASNFNESGGGTPVADIYAIPFAAVGNPPPSPPSPAPPPPPDAGGGAQSVVWTQVVNATAAGGSLQKSGGCHGCDDAGAVSQQQIGSGNGYESL